VAESCELKGPIELTYPLAGALSVQFLCGTAIGGVQLKNGPFSEKRVLILNILHIDRVLRSCSCCHRRTVNTGK